MSTEEIQSVKQALDRILSEGSVSQPRMELLAQVETESRVPVAQVRKAIGYLVSSGQIQMPREQR